MTDIYPYGHPHSYTRDEVHYYLSTLTGRIPDPDIMTAIAQAESSLDFNVINDTPSTGDYSVGAFQINYIDNLYNERSAAYGTPQQLIQDGLPRQANAMLGVWRGQGYSAWTTYTSGAYRQFLGPGAATGPAQAPGQQTAPVVADIAPDTWHPAVRTSTDHFYLMTVDVWGYSRGITAI